MQPVTHESTAAMMAEATIAVGALLRHIPADRVQITPLGVEIETGNLVTFARWSECIGVGEPYEAVPGGPWQYLSVGECNGFDFRVYLTVAVEIVADPVEVTQ